MAGKTATGSRTWKTSFEPAPTDIHGSLTPPSSKGRTGGISHRSKANQMNFKKKPASKLRRPFVAVGAVIGVALSAWYLFNNFGRSTPVPDPIWAKFVNVALLIFSSIYLANVLRRLVELAVRKR
jgi:hypothetical protein